MISGEMFQFDYYYLLSDFATDIKGDSTVAKSALITDVSWNIK